MFNTLNMEGTMGKTEREKHNQSVVNHVFNSTGRSQVLLNEFIEKMAVALRDGDVSLIGISVLEHSNVRLMKQAVRRIVRRSNVLALEISSRGLPQIIRRDVTC